jgi:hypothetical protein
MDRSSPFRNLCFAIGRRLAGKSSLHTWHVANPFSSRSLSLLPVVLASLPPPLSSDSSSSLVSRTHTPPLPVPPRPSRTPSRLLSSLSPTPTASSPPTCGRRPSSSGVPWRSSRIPCEKASDTKRYVFTRAEKCGARSHYPLCFIAWLAG